jgi:hypothetical protein
MRPRRTISRIALCLAAAFIIALASAWIPAVIIGAPTQWTSTNSAFSASIPAYLQSEWQPIPDSASSGLLAFGARWLQVDASNRQRPQERLALTRNDFGWPLTVASTYEFGLYAIPGESLWGRLEDLHRQAGWRTGIALFKPDPQSRGKITLPIWPRWTALPMIAINAILLCAATLAPSALRRAGRRRKGLCSQCAYKLTGEATCPECGTSTN